MEKIIKLNFEKPCYLEWMVTFHARFEITVKLVDENNDILFQDTKKETDESDLYVNRTRFTGGRKITRGSFSLIINIPASKEIDADQQYSYITGDNGKICADHYFVAVEDGYKDKPERFFYNLGVSLINWRHFEFK